MKKPERDNTHKMTSRSPILKTLRFIKYTPLNVPHVSILEEAIHLYLITTPRKAKLPPNADTT